MNPSQIVEAVLFASDAPLSVEDIARADADLDEDIVEEAIRDLSAFYDEVGRSFQIQEIAEGYQILTRPEFAPYLERFDSVPRPNRLSGPALEALAIIAYRQPIGRIEMEYVRGVNSAGVIRTLQERGLVDVVARGEGVGRPLLYGTTHRFLDHFGFASLEDLPRPEELPVVLRDRIPLGIEEDLEDDGPEDIAPPEGPEGDRNAIAAEAADGSAQEAGTAGTAVATGATGDSATTEPRETEGEEGTEAGTSAEHADDPESSASEEAMMAAAAGEGTLVPEADGAASMAATVAAGDPGDPASERDEAERVTSSDV